jgi:hypothetical protein
MCLFFPLKTEGLLGTVIETMNVRIPITSKKVGCVSEVLRYGKGGVLVDRDSAGKKRHFEDPQ